jgi:hypothetical protein
MNTQQIIELQERVNAMPERTEAQRLRKANAQRHLLNAVNDAGACGKVEDILSKAVNSTIVNFSKQGQADCFVWVDGKRYKAERKTNGGRIGALLAKNAPKYVVYSMDVCNSGTSNQRRCVEPKVMRTDLFLAILEDCNAIKSTNGKNAEPAIQVTSKMLYMIMQEYEVTYDPAGRYTADQFDW